MVHSREPCKTMKVSSVWYTIITENYSKVYPTFASNSSHRLDLIDGIIGHARGDGKLIPNCVYLRSYLRKCAGDSEEKIIRAYIIRQIPP